LILLNSFIVGSVQTSQPITIFLNMIVLAMK